MQRSALQTSRLLVGTSGYSYADWVGPVYPPGAPRSKWLNLYAQRFRTVEINSTYYGVARPDVYARMRAVVGDDFVFSVKAPGSVTHDRSEAPAALVRDFATRLEPLGAAAVLLQFPFSFHYEPHERVYLARVLDAFASEMRATQPVVEVRHASWMRPSVIAGLRERGVSLACVDLPALRGLPRGEAVTTGKLGYLRLHGRNARKWWRHEAAWERYDYSYEREELEPWVPRLRRMLAAVQQVLVYANNHFQGQAVGTAELLEELVANNPSLDSS
jgi:uncharacterized protein YecE (DUF72 family)